MVHIEDVLLCALAQKGDRYIFGAEARATDPNPSAFDCSELVEWACARAGVTPTMPDGAFNQWKHCPRITVDQGVRTRGALLFVGDGTGSGRDAIVHVAFSLGDGTTIEARGSKWGVGTWPSVKRFDFAGLIPGADYSPGHGRLDIRPEEDDMRLFNITSGTDKGKYFLLLGNVRSYVDTGDELASLRSAGITETALSDPGWQVIVGMTVLGTDQVLGNVALRDLPPDRRKQADGMDDKLTELVTVTSQIRQAVGK